jgi:hypothetical protein
LGLAGLPSICFFDSGFLVRLGNFWLTNSVRRLAHLIVLAAFILSCGGQWYVLQCVAWANMIREYSEIVPVTQAVQMTFSGQYPCAICKAIAERKSSEQQKSLAFEKYEKKFTAPVSIELATVEPNISSSPYLVYVGFLRSRTDTPPTPPPRLALS